jgi:hypothetical protein
MAEGFHVDTSQLRSHAQNLEALRDRFRAVKAASAHIAQNDSAYGLLCSWMPAILEGRHTKQDELIAYAEENLTLVANDLRTVANGYDTTDDDAADTLNAVLRQLESW